MVRTGGDEGRPVRFRLEDGVISFETRPGATYRVTNEEDD